jgi:hypothetical protein
MSYNITDYTKKRAKEYGVSVIPSHKKNKKIDVIKNGDVIASVGDIRFFDFPTYIKKNGLEFAKNRRRLYYIRHAKDKIYKNGSYSPAFWSAVLLW